MYISERKTNIEIHYWASLFSQTLAAVLTSVRGLISGFQVDNSGARR